MGHYTLSKHVGMGRRTLCILVLVQTGSTGLSETAIVLRNILSFVTGSERKYQWPWCSAPYIGNANPKCTCQKTQAMCCHIPAETFVVVSPGHATETRRHGTDIRHVFGKTRRTLWIVRVQRTRSSNIHSENVYNVDCYM